MSGNKDIVISGTGRESNLYRITLLVLERSLSDYNVSIVPFSDVLSGLSERGCGYTALLVMDHPEGHEFCHDFREKESDSGYERTPILVVTGGDETRAKRIRLEDDIDGVLRKPFQLNELTESVKGILPQDK